MLPICLQALINRLKPEPLRLLPGSLRASALQELLGLQGPREPATQLLHGSRGRMRFDYRLDKLQPSDLPEAEFTNVLPKYGIESQAVTRLTGLRRSRRGCRRHRRLQKRASETLVVGYYETGQMGASDIPEAGQQSANPSIFEYSICAPLGVLGEMRQQKKSKTDHTKSRDPLEAELNIHSAKVCCERSCCQYACKP